MLELYPAPPVRTIEGQTGPNDRHDLHASVNTPEYQAALIEFQNALIQAFNLYYQGLFHPQRNPIYQTDTHGLGFERLTLPEDTTQGLPRVQLEINRGFIERARGEERNRPSDGCRLAQFEENGPNTAGEWIRFKFTLHHFKGADTMQWRGATNLRLDQGGRYSDKLIIVNEVSPIQKAIFRIKELIGEF